jgi:isocitrate lyase
LAKIAGLSRGAASPSQKAQMRASWMSNEPDTLSNAQARRIADSIFGHKDSVSHY